jgi:hypothetical protein
VFLLVLVFVLVAIAVALTFAIGVGPLVVAAASAAFAVAIWFFVDLAVGPTHAFHVGQMLRRRRGRAETASAAAQEARRHSAGT